MSDFKIEHSRGVQDGPADGVRVETTGNYIKLKGHGLFQRDKAVQRKERTNVNIEASVSAGMVLVHDAYRDIAISVSITEMAAILNEALRIGMVKEEK